jgi:hypothetical protein
LLFQRVNLSQQQNAALLQNLQLALRGHSLWLLIQSDRSGCALARLTRFHQHSDIDIDLGDFFPQ